MRWKCMDPIRHKGQAAIERDTEHFKAALPRVHREGVFMTILGSTKT